jgi:DNA-binding NtrC family response regulator
MSIQKPLRILLVDDESSVLNALKLLLIAMKFSVSDFSRARDAIELLNQPETDYDIVLCDLKMPEINGIEALKQIKELRPNIAFILMSAHASSTDIEHAKSHGASGFLAKPFSPTQLVGIIEKSLAELDTAL